MTSPVDLLLRSVERSPDRTAVSRNGRNVSYGELWRRIESLASLLRGHGVGTGERVVLIADNSVHYIVAWYAINRLAAVSVPLNTGLKGSQLREVIVHAQPRLVLHDGHRAELNALAVQLLEHSIALLDLQSGEFTEAAAAPVGGRAVSPPQLRSIVYTSGTTGRPKGVMLSEGNLVSNTRAIIDYLALGPEDRIVCLLPFYYAYGNSILHTHLAAGGTLVLGSSLVYPQKVLEEMERECVTGFAGVPSTFRLLLQRCDLSRVALPRLRYVTQAGGAMSAVDIERIRTSWPRADFFVMYGQTEATARLTYLPPDRLRDKAGSVGRPVAGVRIRILDREGKEKPPGELGEVCASGPNVMQGYWQDAAATRARFYGDWLRTGDLGFQDRDGFTTIVGRSSEMIKVGDHRVSPEEIEEVIGRLPGVEEAAVVGVPDRVLGQVIRAFVVLAPGSLLAKRDILRHCQRECAIYKIPREIVFLPELPKTASGKIQRFRLPDTGQPTEDCV